MLEMQECFLFSEKWKKIILDFWQGTVKYSYFKTTLPVV